MGGYVNRVATKYPPYAALMNDLGIPPEDTGKCADVQYVVRPQPVSAVTIAGCSDLNRLNGNATISHFGEGALRRE